MKAETFCITGIQTDTKHIHTLEYVICLATNKSEADRTLSFLLESKTCTDKYEKLKIRPYKHLIPSNFLLPVKQYQHFMRLFNTLTQIAKGYSTPTQLKKEATKDYGLDYLDALEMAYENIQTAAKEAILRFKFKELSELIEMLKEKED